MAQITTYSVDNSKRRLLTVNNMAELGITDELIEEFLKTNLEKKLPALRRNIADGKGKYILDKNKKNIPTWPTGISINEKIFGNFPKPNAAQRGWVAYLEIGAPLFEERSNIIQPRADVISTRSFENRSGIASNFSDTIEFTIGNTINWSLANNSNFNFGGKISGELQGQLAATLQMSLANSLTNSMALNAEASTTNTNHVHNHKDNQGTQSVIAIGAKGATTATTSMTNTVTGTGSFTATGSAKGAGELSAQKGFAITGTISGTVSTSWKSSSNVSGSLPSNTRIETLATQRRQVKQFTYEIPITFGGYVGLHYEDLVYPITDNDSPVSNNADASTEIPVNISELQLVEKGKLYRPKGVAETVSALDVNHSIFAEKSLPRDKSQKFGTSRPHNL